MIRVPFSHFVLSPTLIVSDKEEKLMEIDRDQMKSTSWGHNLLRGETWSGREDLNLRPPRPERGALPVCATPRKKPCSINVKWLIQQSMGLSNCATGHTTLTDIDSLGKTWVLLQGLLNPTFNQPDYKRYGCIGQGQC